VEEKLLTLARRLLAKLPLRQADLLIVDEIGKDISGSGMDTNIVGRKRAFRQQGLTEGLPSMRLIFVRGLTAKTHGNATGIGLADLTTMRLVKAMDYRATVINALTAGYPEVAALPVHFESDREVLDAALAMIGTRRAPDARIMHIRNTLNVEEVEVSEPCLAESSRQTEFEVVGHGAPIVFDAAGNLGSV
jgi:hypothetical protein